jgi:chromatin remodeling complex protein RSC6
MAKKSVKSATTSEIVENTPAPAPTPVEEQPAANVTPTVVETVTDKYTVVLDRMQDFSNNLKEMMSIIKSLQKEHQKVVKQTTKKNKNGNKEGTKRSPSGFAQPTLLSDQLCDFLNVPHGTSLARTEVTKQINEYIKKNKLQNPEDKRQIIPDSKLKSLLNMKDDDKLSYFNVQSYLKHQFVKTPVAVA